MTAGTSRTARRADVDPRPARAVPYDLVREVLVACGVVLVLVLALSAVLSSPDDPPTTIRSFAQQSPLVFLQTALGDLDGSGEIASYGPPYNQGDHAVQYLGPVSLQKLAGVTIPINTAQDFVLGPLQPLATVEPPVAAALDRFNAASPAQRKAWEAAYGTALDAAVSSGATSLQAPAAAGPVGPMLAGLLEEAQVGSLDGLLLTSSRFYATDYTKPLLFLQGAAMHNRASALNFLGTQWGMMNETGSYPGQAWLWLYTFWYQVPAIATSPNGDAIVWAIMAVLTLLLVLVPWLPGINRLPGRLGVYRWIWRDWYREHPVGPPGGTFGPAGPPGGGPRAGP
jgi:hypothetical protein